MNASKLTAWVLVGLAALFGAALVGTAALASRSLRERDAAVREGILARAGHELEARLRSATPDDAATILRSFLDDHAGSVDGVALLGPRGLLASEGADSTGGFELSAALGREWRPLAFGTDAGPDGGAGPAGSGPGAGPGSGAGFMGGRGGGGRGGFGGRGAPPMRLRLRPAPALGRDSALARFVLVGGAAAAVALVGLALVAARGLTERQRREAAESEGQRLATVARAGAGLAHRLRNPLAVVKGTAQLLEDRVPEAERERVARIVTASGRMETILSRLLDFARPPAPQPATFDLVALARDVAARGGAALVRADGPVSVHADREHVETILEELLANARAFDPDGTIEVTVRQAGGRGVLEVADRGPGPGAEAASAFEPYVTSRPDGTGLGLAIVRSLATANGGSAELAPRPGGGAVASLSLPGREA